MLSMEKSLQDKLVDLIRSKIKPSQNLAIELSELLDIKLDAAYRRINGTTELKLSEVQIISGKYGISIDNLVRQKSNTIPFSGFFEEECPRESTKTGFEHLLGILEELEGSPELEITYLCMEIPFFHLLQVPELLQFKRYVWESVATKIPDFPAFPELADSTFSNDLSGLTDRLVGCYLKVPSIEIVYHSALTATAKQILFFLESGKFSCPSDALLLFERLHDLVAHMKTQVTLGKKIRFGSDGHGENGAEPLQFFFNEMLPSQNTVAVRSQEKQVVYLECNVTDFIWTNESKFCRRVFRSIEDILANSIPISRVSAKERNKYFLHLEAEVFAKQRIAEGLLGNPIP